MTALDCTQAPDPPPLSGPAEPRNSAVVRTMAAWQPIRRSSSVTCAHTHKAASCVICPRCLLEKANPSERLIVGALGFTQILGYGTTFYLPAILGLPISSDTGWPLPWIIAGL